MSNGLRNAGFLEEDAGWNKTAQLTLTVDSTVRGGTGRHVLVGAGTTTATNQLQKIWSDPIDVASGQFVEAYSGLVASHAEELVIEWLDAGEAVLASTLLIMTGPELTVHGTGVHGLRQTFSRGYYRGAVYGAAVKARIRASVQPAANGAAVEISLVKPMLGITPTLKGAPTPWDPGVHEEEGLDLPCWPSILRPFIAGPTTEPTPVRSEYVGVNGVPATRRLVIEPQRKLKGRLRCDAIQRAALETFFRDAHPAFWIVDPETEQLCVGRWAAGGEPRAAEIRGVTVMMEVGLTLEIG